MSDMTDDIDLHDLEDEDEVMIDLSESLGTPSTFTTGGSGLSALDNPTPLGRDNALQKLGRPPFERSARTKFRLLGFLATVYEHVADDLKHANQDDAKAEPQESDAVDAAVETAEVSQNVVQPPA